MFRSLIFYTLSIFSMLFLFISPGPLFNYSSFVFYVLSGMSTFIVLTFFFYYKKFFSKTIEKQLEHISTLNTDGKATWFAYGSPYLTRIFAAMTPYTIGIASITNSLYLWFDKLSLIRYLAVIILSIQGILMLLLLMGVIYNLLFTRGRDASDLSLQ